MNIVPLSIASLIFLITFTASSNNPAHLTGDVSINCGSSGTSAARNGREWIGDVHQKLSSFLQIQGLSTTSAVIHKLTSAADPVPHKTARISTSRFSYGFQVKPGQKIIRLHFNPAQYKGFKEFKDLFTVEAGPFTLLSNFSPSLNAHALGLNSFAKEFCLNIEQNKPFNVVFSPESSHTLDTYAFINGIEIISVPTILSYFHGGDIGIQVVSGKSLVIVDHNTALEMMHRSEIKQNSVPFAGDSHDMFPNWATKNSHGRGYNMWTISVDTGFMYLIRLHFSEQGLKIAGTGDVMFDVLINEMIAHSNIDKMTGRDENSIPQYRDYMVMIRGQKKEGKHDLLIALQSYDKLMEGHRLLSGLEIFKLSNPDNSLASPNALPPARVSSSQTIQTLLLVLGQRNVIATVAITIISIISISVHKLREMWEASKIEEDNKPSARAQRLCRRFSLTEIQSATRNFSGTLLIGRGGFGKVYKGLIDKGEKTVAVKRLKSRSHQGAHEFLTEIETLSDLRHINLVSLIGYCNEHGEMILVYEYMAGGTLADHLYKLCTESNNTRSLTWKQRLDVCIGAGRGLDYLHTGHGVIHRDVKASNILLDENFVAKVADFGLAKTEDKRKLQSHITTKVKGTRWYLDPYYCSTKKLTRKSDTYAFGVVLLEVVCGRPAVDSKVEEDEYILSKWARNKTSKGEVDQIVDSSLRDEMSPYSLKTFVEVAERCLHDEPKNRPTMSQVVLQLELALERHENKHMLLINEIASTSHDDIRPCNDEIDRPGTASTDVPEITLPTEEQRKIGVVRVPSGSEHGQKATISKPSRLWPWNSIWRKVKPSKKTEFLLSEILEECRAADLEFSKFDWVTLLTATHYFSNKVGQGEFGTVYKGEIPLTGQQVAVKRFLPSHNQGLEFKNEILLLTRLQHGNIIKLLGYCTHGEEKLLVYEFMQDADLESFIFGTLEHHLQWSVRFKIITGIAEGVVYLQSVGVIHRNLRLCTILLDFEMNPKISGFAFAMNLAKHQLELETSQVVGYIQSDVYSFGIIVLQMVSGRRIIEAPYSDPVKALVDYAWKLWNEGEVLELVDESIRGAFSADEVLRCIQVGLLCTQKQPNYRSSMPSALKLLQGELATELQVEPLSQ